MPTLILGTRGSKLALWQAHHVRATLEAHDIEVHLQEITTKGDRVLDVPLAEIGDKGLFTKELDLALLEGHIHLAVHSLKDLPTALPAGIVLAAVGERASPWDAFVAHPAFDGLLEDLPEGAVLATSSLRRQAQLRAWRSDLTVVPVRGNVDTRLRKLDESDWHGIILAAAGLERLGLEDRIRELISIDVMIPAVSQGALGIVCAELQEQTVALLHEVLHHAPTAAAVRAERAFLRRLEGGCQAPIGAYARHVEETLVLDGCVAMPDGSRLLRDRHIGMPAEPETLGVGLAEALFEQGGGTILHDIRAVQGT